MRKLVGTAEIEAPLDADIARRIKSHDDADRPNVIAGAEYVTQEAPRLRARFAVMVAGHRTGRLPSEQSQLAKIDQAMEQWLLLARKLFLEASKSATLLYGPPHTQDAEVTLVTGAAPGADRMAMSIAGRHKLSINLIGLVDDTRDGFTAVPSRSTRQLLFDTAKTQYGQHSTHAIRDETALAACDLLILVWDGAVSQNVIGGTDRIMRDAILMRRPIIWVDTTGFVRLLRIELLTDTMLRSLRTEVLNPNILETLFEDASETRLTSLVLQAVDPFEAARKGLIGHHGLADLKKYFTGRSRWPRTMALAGRMNAVLTAAVLGRSIIVAMMKDKTKPWYGAAASRADGTACFLQEPVGIETRFAWSDRKANIAAGFHRDSIWGLYLSSAFAVLAAVAGAIGLWPHGGEELWPLTEVALISGIFGMLAWSRMTRWHSQWLSHRFIAEQLRYLRAGMPFCIFQNAVAHSSYKSSEDPRGSSKIELRNMEQWILRRVFIAEGVPQTDTEDSMIFINRHFPNHKKYLHGFVSAQRAYHLENANLNHRLAHRLHRMTVIAFLTTAAIILLHFIFHAEWLSLFTAGLPGFASALHGISTQNEYRRLELISHGMSVYLKEILEALEKTDLDKSDIEASWLRLRAIAQEAYYKMSNVNEEWQTLVREHGSSLPA